MLREFNFRAVIEPIGIISLLSLGLFIFRILLTGNLRYWFIPGNLALAWGALLLAWVLTNQLKRRRWLSWPNAALTVLWLVILPNTWYVLTDFIHVYPTGEISELYDIVLVSTLVFCGFLLGIISLLKVHGALAQRLGTKQAYWVVEAIILISSFGVYLGRVLRWNSWDVLTNPSGLLVNVSDRLIDPLGHPRSLTITGLFFVLISVIYLAFYRGWSLSASKS